jgi:transposase
MYMSWLLSSGSDFLPNVSLSTLRKRYSAETDAKAKLRLLSGIHRKQGKTIDDIAASLHKPRRTVHGWLWRLEEAGLNGAVDKPRSGRPKRLSAKQLLALRSDLLKEPTKHGHDATFWNTRLVQEHVRQKFGTLFVSRHMTRLLHKLGFSLKKPRPSDCRANKAEQQRFKKNLKGWFPS